VDTAQQILDASSDGAIFMKSWANGKAFIKFVVEDTGTGIEPSDYPKIFSAFEQVRATKHMQASLLTRHRIYRYRTEEMGK
jgi:K+-sensing histidine kinase KdpD